MAEQAKRTIILDTNFLLIPAQAGVDIFTEIERICTFPHQVVVLESSVKELETIQKTAKKGKDKDAAKLALQLVEAKAETQNINRVASAEAYVDKAILDLASKDKDLIIATQDAELKQKLKGKGNSLIIMRQQTHLVLLDRQ